MDIPDFSENVMLMFQPWMEDAYLEGSVIMTPLLFYTCMFALGLWIVGSKLAAEIYSFSVGTGLTGLILVLTTITIIKTLVETDFRLGCWMDLLAATRLHDFFEWRIYSISVGAFWSYVFNKMLGGNFKTEGSLLSILSPADSFDLGFSVMRINIPTTKEIKEIMLLAVINYAASCCVVFTLAWGIFPFWMNATSMDCVAFAAMYSCIAPDFCTKCLGLERNNTHSLHLLLVGESIISNILGGLLMLLIQYGRKCAMVWYCVLNVVTYAMSGLVGYWLGCNYASTVSNNHHLFFQNGSSYRILYKVTMGICCFTLVALSMASWLQFDYSTAALTLSTTVVRLTGLPQLTSYNFLSLFLDVGGYMRIGIFAFHSLHRWDTYGLVCTVMLFSMVGRLPAVLFSYRFKKRGPELWIIWLAGLVRGFGLLALAKTPFGGASSLTESVLMSTTISVVLLTNLLMGPLISWIVSSAYPVIEAEEMDHLRV